MLAAAGALEAGKETVEIVQIGLVVVELKFDSDSMFLMRNLAMMNCHIPAFYVFLQKTDFEVSAIQAEQKLKQEDSYVEGNRDLPSENPYTYQEDGNGHDHSCMVDED